MLTLSDRVSRGVLEDTSGDVLEELLRAEGYEVERRVVPDEREQIVAALTVYDMAKAIDKQMVVAEVRLLEKTKEPV